MSIRFRCLLVFLGLLVVLVPARLEQAPGYMDAEYYTAGGLRLAQGYGFSEQVLWNYLDDPAGLPHPSHAYWMPLPSMAAALGMRLLGRADFSAARWPFLLLAALIPWLTAEICWQLTNRLEHARLAGGLALTPGYYWAYLSTTDSFVLVMLVGGLFFYLLARRTRSAAPAGPAAPTPPWSWRVGLGLGMLAGLLHLSRADGLLWLAVAGLAVWWQGRTFKAPLAVRMRSLLGVLVGYGLLFGPWMARNYIVFGTPLAPGGARALWLVTYDDTFRYPASILTGARWLASGWSAIMRERGYALGQNVMSTWAVQGLIFLLPMMLAGAWSLRRNLAVQAGVFSWAALLLGMSLFFPFQGVRGGFFHSAAALQPLWWAVVPVGLEQFLEWGRRRRNWQPERSRPIFQALILVIALLLSAGLMYGRVVGDDPTAPTWNSDWKRSQEVERALLQWGAQPGQVVMVNNPAGYYVSVQRPAVVIPYEHLAGVRTAAAHYAAEYLLIDIDQVIDEKLIDQPGDRPGLHYLGQVDTMHVYRFIRP